MALALTALQQNRQVNSNTLYVKVVPSGNYVTGGDALNLAAIGNPGGLYVSGPSGIPPVPVGIFSESSGGNYAEVIAGATLANFKLKFYQPGGAEVAAGAYPGAISGGTLVLAIIFND